MLARLSGLPSAGTRPPIVRLREEVVANPDSYLRSDPASDQFEPPYCPRFATFACVVAGTHRRYPSLRRGARMNPRTLARGGGQRSVTLSWVFPPFHDARNCFSTKPAS